jgi:hypothetical protein
VSDIFKVKKEELDAKRAKQYELDELMEKEKIEREILTKEMEKDGKKMPNRPRGNNRQNNPYGGNRAAQGAAGPNTAQKDDQDEAGASFELVAGPRRELLSLQGYMRKYKVLTMMKNVLASERHERELANQRAQLTSNAALWD